MMMKRVLPFLLGFTLSISICLAGYSDGYITAGEYEGFVEWSTYNPPLIVEGGGANVIEVRNNGRLEVRLTSIPVGGDFHTGGIRDIYLFNTSHLDYFGGITEEITIASNATATLKGGQIDYITSLQTVGWVNWEPVGQHIEMEVRDHSYNSTTNILTGHWADYTTFSIQLLNQSDYDNVIDNIKFTIIPEPAMLLLFGLGGLLLRCKQ
jgi:hypothetical protein